MVWEWKLHCDNWILNSYIHGGLKMATNSFHLLWSSEVYSPSLEGGLALWHALTKRLRQKWHCVTFERWPQKVFQFIFSASCTTACHSVNKSRLVSMRTTHREDRDLLGRSSPSRHQQWAPDGSDTVRHRLSFIYTLTDCTCVTQRGHHWHMEQDIHPAGARRHVSSEAQTTNDGSLRQALECFVLYI